MYFKCTTYYTLCQTLFFHAILKKVKKHEAKKQELTGVIKITSRGFGVVREKGGEKEVLVEKEDLATALHGDIVRVIISGKTRKNEPAGKVEEILIRAKVGHAGILEKKDGQYFVTSSDPRMYAPIIVKEDALLGGKVGEKVFAEITDWKVGEKYPTGKIIKVLGVAFSKDAEMEGIALERGFVPTFTDEVEKEAKDLYQKTSIELEAKNRRDFRGIATFTIDPEDAKDFDDALSVHAINDDHIEIGVHIADVSFYVKPDTKLDDEAFRRGTSIYLVDRTIPMLPEVLSNDLCSLKPNVDRLCVSAVFTIDKKGEVIDSWYGRTIIHSQKRFTYEEAEEVRAGRASGPFKEEIDTLEVLAKRMQKDRSNSGSIDFEQDEVKFKLDDGGYPIEIIRKIRLDTHRLIEEWMLLANRYVAEHMSDETESPLFLYRIHDIPDHDKMADLLFFLKRIGYPQRVNGKKITGKMIQDILKDVKGTKEESLVNTTIIRTMAKAIYSTKNIGHFGLAFPFYTHFTSPIRRYPDIMVHRLLLGEVKTNDKKVLKDFEYIATYTSEREKTAADAERTSVKYAQVAYMAKHIGEARVGIISGITENGIFVEELKSKAEGFIQTRSIERDTLKYDKAHLALRSTKSGRSFRIGDKINVIIDKVDRNKNTIDYILDEKHSNK